MNFKKLIRTCSNCVCFRFSIIIYVTLETYNYRVLLGFFKKSSARTHKISSGSGTCMLEEKKKIADYVSNRKMGRKYESDRGKEENKSRKIK